MADIQPFCAIRYDLGHVGKLSDVVCPPYDVITPEMQDELYKRHPANYVRITLNRPEPGDAPGAIYQRAANFLRNWMRQGVLRQDSRAAIYVYNQEFELDGVPVTRRGFVSRVRLEKFGEGRIYPHEETHSGAKQDRLNLWRATGCNTSQIFSIYNDEENEVMAVLEKSIADPTPIQAVDDAGVVHKVWMVVDTGAIARVSTLMGSRELFIADGHHRYETGLNYLAERNADGEIPFDHPARYVSMCCVSMGDPGMVVLPTHRLWRGAAPVRSVDLIERLGSFCHCEVIGRGPELADSVWKRIHEMGEQSQMAFYCAADDSWVMVELAESGHARMKERVPDKSAAWRQLGVSILHELLVPDLLGLKDLPAPKYVRGIDEVVESLRAGDATGRDATGQQGLGGRFELATIVMPATIEHVREISKAGERMPAKSTYFYPKLLSGLLLNPIAE